MSFPKSIVAGDSASFTVHDLTYPADEGWVSKYVIASATPVSVDGVADGVDHQIDITTAVSAALAIGSVATFMVYTKDDERQTVPAGNVLILPNPTAALPESFARTALVQVEAALLKLGRSVNASVNINGETYTKRDILQLSQWRDRLIVEVGNELRAYGRPGRGGTRTIRTVFRN